MTNILAVSPSESPRVLRKHSQEALTPELSPKLLAAVHQALNFLEYQEAEKESTCQRLCEAGIYTPDQALALRREDAEEMKLKWEFVKILQKNLIASLKEFLPATDPEASALALHWTDNESPRKRSSRTSDPGVTASQLNDFMSAMIGVMRAKHDELLTTITETQQSKHEELLDAVMRTQASTERSGMQVEAKIDASMDKIAKTIETEIQKATANVIQDICSENGGQLVIVKQQIESQKLALIQHQSDWNTMYSHSLSAAEETQGRMFEALSAAQSQQFAALKDSLNSNLAQANTTLNAISEFTSQAAQDFAFRRNMLQDSSINDKEVLRMVYDIPDQVHRHNKEMSDLIKVQLSSVRDTCAEMRGSLNTNLDAMHTKLTTRIDVLTQSFEDGFSRRMTRGIRGNDESL
jgi:hypothetical protein